MTQERPMRICMLGAGGLGSIIGGYLAESGQDVTLIARPAHVEAIRRGGLRIEGRRGDLLIREHLSAVSHPDQAEGEFDYLILAVKAKDTEVALASADRLKARVATVCSAQNGVEKEDVLGRWAGIGKVLGFSIVEGGTLLAPGRALNHLTATTTIYCGEMDGRISLRAQRLAEACTRAHLSARAVDCIRQVIWEKLAQVCNASAWSVSLLAGNPKLNFTDGLMRPEGVEHFAAVARDILAVYCGMGYEPQNFYAPFSRLREFHQAGSFAAAVEVAKAIARRMQETGYRGRTSMHDDLLRGSRTEVDQIIKPMIDKARELGIAVPTLDACYRIIKVLDEHLQ